MDLVDSDGNNADMTEICKFLELFPQRQEFEAFAARANLTAIARSLHDKSSQLMEKLIHALGKGKLCVIEVSRLHGSQSLCCLG